MIIPDQKNLKLHFAGSEQLHQTVAMVAGGAQYTLFSVYKLICDKIGEKPILLGDRISQVDTPGYIEPNFRHTIMDSGLFTLMFGSSKGKKDRAFLMRWLNWLIEMVQASGYGGTCVEIDCQKILSPKVAWEFRQIMRDRLPNNRIMNVFHKEDGIKGLDRMIEFSDYIALSIPELRILQKKDYSIRLANYIKNKKPEIDIHLLGCSEVRLLRQLDFCSSADSTSWLAPLKYGKIRTVRGDCHIRQFQKSPLLQRYSEIFTETAVKLGFEPDEQPTSDLYNASLTFSIEQHRLVYTKAAGSQY